MFVPAKRGTSRCFTAKKQIYVEHALKNSYKTILKKRMTGYRRGEATSLLIELLRENRDGATIDDKTDDCGTE